MVFLSLPEVLFNKQMDRGDQALAENPWDSAARLQRPIQRIIRRPGVLEVPGDMCASDGWSELGSFKELFGPLMLKSPKPTSICLLNFSFL